VVNEHHRNGGRETLRNSVGRLKRRNEENTVNHRFWGIKKGQLVYEEMEGSGGSPHIYSS
jgi:hypothetical protein